MINVKDILLIVDSVSNEKNISKDMIFEIIEQSIEAAIKKQAGFSKTEVARVKIDPKTGEYDAWKLSLPEDQEELLEEYGSIKKIPDEFLEITPVEPMEFNRIAAQTAKQTIHQKLKEAKRMAQEEYMLTQIGKIFNCPVKRVSEDTIFLSGPDDITFILPKTELMPYDHFNSQSQIKAVLIDVRPSPRGNALIMSRASELFLREFFHIEIPEISENIIQIKGIAREPGVRSKVAVKTNDRRIDAVGACVGMRGSRIHAISDLLGGERIDVIEWNPDIAQLIINVMAPSQISSITINEDTQTAEIIVDETNYAQAIGKNGLNVRLASQLAGWFIQIISQAEANKKSKQEAYDLIAHFEQHLLLNETQAQVLIDAGFSSIEEIAGADTKRLNNLSQFDNALIDDLLEKSNNFLLIQLLSSPESISEINQLSQFNEAQIKTLESHELTTIESIAELSVDELLDIIDMDRELAGEVILEARKPWFEKTDPSN